MIGKKRLYLIGIDSTPLWLLNELKAEHELSGFDYFLKNGILRDLKSTIPPVTSAAWPSIYTGLEPRHHGVLEFTRIDSEYNKQLMYYDSSSPRPFWEVLASKGLKCLVITPAVFLENRKIRNVDLITGWPLQPRYSSGELEAYSKKFGFNGEPDIGMQLNSGKISLAHASRLYTRSIKARVDLAKYLIEKNDYDMVFVCFTETDRMQHYALGTKGWQDAVAPLYIEISNFIKWLVAFAEKKGPEYSLLVASDHGAQPTPHKFLTNSWLVKMGYASFKAGFLHQSDATAQGRIYRSLKRKISERIATSSVRRQVYERLPSTLQKIGEKFVEENLDTGNNSYLKMFENDLDMLKTKAFASVSNGNMGMIWINDRRFSSPSVSRSEKGKLKADIVRDLRSIKNIEGSALISKIYDGAKLYHGITSFIPPDIVFQLCDGYTGDFSHHSNSIFVEPEKARRGDHTTHGIFGMVQNGGRQRKFKKGGITVYNVAPTIAKYFGVSMKSKKSLI